jgi:hypothetical protein
MLVVETIAKIRRAYFFQNKPISDQLHVVLAGGRPALVCVLPNLCEA